MSRFAMRIKEFIIGQCSKVVWITTSFVSSRLVNRGSNHRYPQKSSDLCFHFGIRSVTPVDPGQFLGDFHGCYQPWNFSDPESWNATLLRCLGMIDPSRRLLDRNAHLIGEEGHVPPSNDAGGWNPCGRGRYRVLSPTKKNISCSNQDFSMKVFSRCAIDKWYNYTWRIIPVKWLVTRGKTPLKPFGRGTTRLRDILAMGINHIQVLGWSSK